MTVNIEDELENYRNGVEHSKKGTRQRGPGRRALPWGQRKMNTSISIKPAHAAFAAEQARRAGFTGNLSAGIAHCIILVMQMEQNAIDAIGEAAGARNQDEIARKAEFDKKREEWLKQGIDHGHDEESPDVWG